MPEPPSVTITRRVHWFDTDTSSKEHNSAPLRWMEEAEAALLDELGVVKELYGSIPRVRVEMNYRTPLRFWDEVEVTVRVAELGRSSIIYIWHVTRDGETAVDGRVVAVHIDGSGAATPWSQEHRRVLTGEAPGLDPAPTGLA